jgi:hypothetical protein
LPREQLPLGELLPALGIGPQNGVLGLLRQIGECGRQAVGDALGGVDGDRFGDGAAGNEHHQHELCGDGQAEKDARSDAALLRARAGLWLGRLTAEPRQVPGRRSGHAHHARLGHRGDDIDEDVPPGLGLVALGVEPANGDGAERHDGGEDRKDCGPGVKKLGHGDSCFG